MQNTFSLLSYLLTKHDCVIIPGFGGFVVHHEHAQCSAAEGVFIPPFYTIGFNAELRHNDGLLINALMRVEKTNYATARNHVELFAEDLQKQLTAEGKILFPEIGSLTSSPEGTITFSPAKDTSANAPMYGFSNFHLPLLDQLEAVEEMPALPIAKDKNVILIPIRKSFIKAIAGAAAIILAVLMISSPISNTIPTQYASVIDVHTLDISKTGAIVHTGQEIKVKESITSTPIPTEVTTEEVKANEVIANTTKTPGRTYYIIVSSSPTRKGAEKLLPAIRSELTPQANIIEKDNLCRVYIAQFSDKQEAESFLNDFRTQHPKHDGAWLLSVKNQPAY